MQEVETTISSGEVLFMQEEVEIIMLSCGKVLYMQVDETIMLIC